MTDINLVTEGAYAGKSISVSFGTISIKMGTFEKPILINQKTVEDFDLIRVNKYESSKSYTVSLLFKSGEKSLLHIDSSVYEDFLKIWPEKKEDRLKKLLQDGYTVVGFSSFDFASSGLGAGFVSHNILLQKGLNLEKISFVTSGDKQLDGKSHIFSSE